MQELLQGSAVSTINEVVSSESFHQRMADLRDAQRALTRSVRALYQAERGRLIETHKEVIKRLQARPSWRRITDEDRAPIERELTLSGLPEEPQDPLGALQRALTRRLGLAELEERLARKVDERGAVLERQAADRLATAQEPIEPAEPTTTEATVAVGTVAVGTVAVGPPAEPVPVGDLLPERALTSAADVERWIADLRARLLERVQLGPIRLTMVERSGR